MKNKFFRNEKYSVARIIIVLGTVALTGFLYVQSIVNKNRNDVMLLHCVQRENELCVRDLLREGADPNVRIGLQLEAEKPLWQFFAGLAQPPLLSQSSAGR